MQKQRTSKIIYFSFLFLIAVIIFILTLFYWIGAERKLPREFISHTSKALRGSIISSDNYHLSASSKLYKAIIDLRNLDPEKKDLFVKLYSIYSGTPQKEIYKKLKNAKTHNVTISYDITPKNAKHMKELARKLYRLGVFKFYHDKKRDTTFLHGLSILESGEKRVYNYKDSLTPIIGYIKKYEEGGFTRIKGVKGLEQKYNSQLNPKQDELIRAHRDVIGALILDGHKSIKAKQDGTSLNISINLKLQTSIEDILDTYKKNLKNEEIIAAVMDSKTGEILSLATSNRFDPKNIHKKDYDSLNIKAIEYEYEPGSVMKPFIFSNLLENNKVKIHDLINGHNGKYRLNRKMTITDSHKFDWMSAEHVIIHSSNIGIAQLVQKLSGIKIHNTLKKLGFTKKSGIDLSYEKSGQIPSIVKLNSETYKATVSYGYGMKANFMQVLKAYNLFNNQGKEVIPHLVKSTKNTQGKITKTKILTSKQPLIKPSVISTMKNILIKTVKEGTGKAAQIENIQIGGKTGTAHIAAKGGYSDLYNSSFFGFANGANHKYTIGVLVHQVDKKHKYFASQSAVPIFKEIVESMIEHKLITSNAK